MVIAQKHAKLILLNVLLLLCLLFIASSASLSRMSLAVPWVLLWPPIRSSTLCPCSPSRRTKVRLRKLEKLQRFFRDCSSVFEGCSCWQVSSPASLRAVRIPLSGSTVLSLIYVLELDFTSACGWIFQYELLDNMSMCLYLSAFQIKIIYSSSCCFRYHFLQKICTELYPSVILV